MSESEPITFSPHTAGNYRGHQTASSHRRPKLSAAPHSLARNSPPFSPSTAARSPRANGATTPSISDVRRRCSRVFRRASEVPLFRIEKVAEAGAQAGRLQRRGAGRADPQTRPRPGPRPQRARRPPPPRRRVAAAAPRPRLSSSGLSRGPHIDAYSVGRRCRCDAEQIRRSSERIEAWVLGTSREDDTPTAESTRRANKSEGPRNDPRPLPIQWLRRLALSCGCRTG